MLFILNFSQRMLGTISSVNIFQTYAKEMHIFTLKSSHFNLFYEYLING